jgi:hypothetical protein
MHLGRKALYNKIVAGNYQRKSLRKNTKKKVEENTVGKYSGKT